MRGLSIPAGIVTPSVEYDKDTKSVVFDGQSYPENAREYYQPVLDWFQEYLADGPVELKVSLHLLYLNTTSVSVFMNLFRLLEDGIAAGSKIDVEWYHDLENDPALEMGEEFEWQVKLPFTIKALTGENS